MEHYERIRSRRNELGLTQKEVADKLFIKHNTYSQYETGARKIDSETLFNIVDILEMDPRYFQKGYEEKKKLMGITDPMTKLFNKIALMDEEEKNEHSNKIAIVIDSMKTIEEKNDEIIIEKIIHSKETEETDDSYQEFLEKLSKKLINTKTIEEKYDWDAIQEFRKNTAEILKDTFPNEFIAATLYYEFFILTNTSYTKEFLKNIQTKLNEIHPEIFFTITHTITEKTEES